MKQTIKKLIFNTKEIIITYILSYIIIISACIIYSLLGFQNLDTFINKECVIILLIYYIGTLYYLYSKNKKLETTRKPLSLPSIYPLLALGISIAVLMNMIIFLFNPPQITTTPTILSILSSGIVGPIYEEILFRFLLYNRLKQQYPIKKAMTITTILFALIHLSPIKILYALILGTILTIIYEDKKNLLAPIIIHISANSIVLILTKYNTDIFLLSIACLFLSTKAYFLVRK